ncbi:MAG: tetratricopeptide repeat protein [Bacteroidota bacterium]
MRLIDRIILPILLIISLPTLLFAQDISDKTHRADSLYDSYEEEEALEAYRDILEEEPENFEALWRTSFLYSRVGNRFENKDDQKKYFNRGIELAEKALEVDSSDAQSNFVMSVAMGRKALVSGARDRVAASREIKKYADRTLEIDSTHAGAWHLLGRWHFKVANLSWVERTAANTLFGGIPGDASNEKAVEAVQKAIELNDNYVLYYYDLATVYEEMGNDSEAIEACETAVEKENLTPDDPMLKEKCRKLIYDLR